ncbi:MAG: hypothetical protein ACI9CD_000707 [Candidatus Deianiraeaceae bacterium]
MDEVVDRQLELMKERLLSDKIKSIKIEGFLFGGMHAMAFVAAIARLPKDERDKISKKIQSLQLHSPVIHTSPSMLKDIREKIWAFFVRLFRFFSTNPSIRRYVDEIKERNGENIIPETQLCYSKEDTVLNFDDKTVCKLQARLDEISTLKTHPCKASQHQLCKVHKCTPSKYQNFTDISKATDVQKECTQTMPKQSRSNPEVMND